MTPMDVAERVTQNRERLTAAQRRVAEVVLTAPEAVAFGTVAEVAARARAGAASVVRLATALGYEGWSDLQSAVQGDLSRRLSPATERIRGPVSDDLLARAAELEVANVRRTLAAVDRDAFAVAVGLLADLDRQVMVISGDASSGVAAQLGGELGMLRPGVQVSGPGEVALGRALAGSGPGHTVLALDLRRYDRAVVAAGRWCAEAGAALVALTDRPMSPLARRARVAMVVSADGTGPFDSYVGALALGNALVTGVADGVRELATERLDAIERAWREAGALLDD